MRDELLEQSLKRCDEVFAEPARQIEQLQAENALLKAEIEQIKGKYHVTIHNPVDYKPLLDGQQDVIKRLLDDVEQIKAHNRQLVALLDNLSKSASRLTRWPFNLEHASDGQYDTFCEQKHAYERADYNASKALQAPPAKLALAEAEVLRLAMNAANTGQVIWSELYKAVEAMKEAKGDG